MLLVDTEAVNQVISVSLNIDPFPFHRICSSDLTTLAEDSNKGHLQSLSNGACGYLSFIATAALR